MAKDLNLLAPAEKREWKSLIVRRQETMLAALDDQLGGSIDSIIAELRIQRGITLTEGELQELVEAVDEQIKAEIAKHLGDEKRRLEIDIETTNDDYDTKEREMKQRHKQEWDELGKARKARLEELRTQARSAEERVAKQHTGELLTKKQEYQRQLTHVREAEKLIGVEADQRLRVMQRSKGKLINLITDAGGRALEQLMVISTKEEAKSLLESIPTVSEAVELCRSAEGVQTLMGKLDPNIKALPAPAPANNVVSVASSVIDATATEIIDVDIPTTIEESDNGDSRDREYLHDREVYNRR